MATTISGTSAVVPRARAAHSRAPVQKMLLACGALYAVVYVVANDVLAAAMVPGYSRTSQAISELSASGSPAQPFLTAVVPLQSALLIAFGIGVWRAARGSRGLRAVGALLVAQGLTGFFWLLAPMSQRQALAAEGGRVQDVLHLVLSGLSVAFVLAELGIGAAATHGAFRGLSLAAIAVVVATSVGTTVMASSLPTGGATPGLGLIERGILGAWLSWMAVLAIALLLDRDLGRSGRTVVTRAGGGTPAAS